MACISLQALTSTNAYQTMRVVGLVQKRPVHILIDTSNTHNFIDFEYAKKLACVMESISLQSITVADGNKIPCQYVCRDLARQIIGQLFTTDVLFIRIGSWDMVLGIQWLKQLGEVY